MSESVTFAFAGVVEDQSYQNAAVVVVVVAVNWLEFDTTVMHVFVAVVVVVVACNSSASSHEWVQRSTVVAALVAVVMVQLTCQPRSHLTLYQLMEQEAQIRKSCRFWSMGLVVVVV